jgi:hypothetical protein
MRAAFNLTGDEKNSEFVTAYCCNILLKKMICFGNRAINGTHFPLNQLAKLDFLCNYLPFLFFQMTFFTLLVLKKVGLILVINLTGDEKNSEFITAY